MAETTGAVSAAFDTLLRHLGRLARSKGTVDHTGYGTARSSPRDFYRHHLSAHSAAVVFADVTTILNVAAHESFWLTVAGGRPAPRARTATPN